MDYNKVFNLKYIDFKSFDDFYKRYKGKVNFDLKDAWEWIEKNKKKEHANISIHKSESNQNNSNKKSKELKK